MKTDLLTAWTRRLPTRFALTFHWQAAALWGVVLASGMAIASPATAETISPRRLVEAMDLGNPVISPDGKSVAFRAEQPSIERNTHDSVWYVQRLDDGSAPRRVGEGGTPLREFISGVVLPSRAAWSPDGRWIYFRAYMEDRIAVWRAAVDGSGMQPVTFDTADVRDFGLSDDGLSLRYSIGATREGIAAAEQREYDRGVRIDDKVVLSAGLLRSSRVEGRAATQRYLGDWFSTGPLLADMPDRWRIVELSTMAARDLATEPPVAGLTVTDLPAALPEPWKLALDQTGGRIALLTRVGDGEGLSQKPSVELAVSSGRLDESPVICRDALCTNQAITDVQWRTGTDEILFKTIEYARGRAHSVLAWNVVSGQVRVVVKADGLLSGASARYWDIPCAVSVDTLVCVAAEADRPPRLESIDLATGDRRVLFAPNAGLEADIAAAVPARLIRWRDSLDREFTGFLFESRAGAGDKPSPLFINFYNCDGFLRGGFGDEWPLASLAESGISALCINAIPEFRYDFVQRHEQGRLAVESVVEHLAAQRRVDPAKVGMGGLSYGSEVALWTAINSDVLSTASLSTPATNQTYYLFNSLREGFRSGLMDMWQLGAPEETPERWRQISPTFNLDRVHIPLIFQMAEQEYRLALEYAIPLAQRLQADIYAFPDEAHIKFQPRHKLAVNERNLDWFRFWLAGHEDQDPAKSDQYRVWRRMKEAAADRRSREMRQDGS